MATIAGGTVGAGGTYPTWEAWKAAAPASLVSADVIWQGRQLPGELVSVGAALALSGFTTDATHYFDITTEVGASFRDNASKGTNPGRYDAAKGAAVRCTDAPYAFLIQQSFTRVHGLQVSSPGGAAIVVSGNATDVDIFGNIIESASTTYLGALFLEGATCKARRNLIMQHSTDAIARIVGLSANAHLYNNTMVATRAKLNAGVTSQYGYSPIKNCAVFGVVAAVTADGYNPVITNSFTDGTGGGWTVAPFSTATFENVTYGTHDFRLKAGSALIDAGVADATNASTDILGNTSPYGAAYDVGAFEFGATSPVVDGVPPAFAQGAVITPSNVGADKYTISWPAATDDTAVASYEVNNNGTWVNVGNVLSKTFTPVASSTLFHNSVRAVDAANNKSAALSLDVTTTAPNLSAPTGAASGATSYTGSVATDGGGGTLYYLPLPAASAAPSVATIKASGATQAVNATGTRTVSGSGLTQNTAYRLHFLQTDAAGGNSAVVSSGSFTTAVLDTIAPTFPNGAVITPGAITSSSVAFSYPAATDTAPGVVAGYETSKDGVWQDNGTGLSGQYNGVPSQTTVAIQVRAYDNANPKNYSAVLSLSMTTTAASTGTFKTRQLANNTGTLYATGTAVAWQWHAATRIGSPAAGVTYGSGSIASDGTLSATGLPVGPGYLLAAILGANLAADKPYYQAGTVA